MGDEFHPYGALSTPLHQTAIVKQPSATKNGPYDYTRSGNPTRDILERLLAKLEKADRAFCFTSGMAALSTVANLVGSGLELLLELLSSTTTIPKQQLDGVVALYKLSNKAITLSPMDAALPSLTPQQL